MVFIDAIFTFIHRYYCQSAQLCASDDNSLQLIRVSVFTTNGTQVIRISGLVSQFHPSLEPLVR